MSPGRSAMRDAFAKDSRIHRDISLGNVILVRDPTRPVRKGVLIDWEVSSEVDADGNSRDLNRTVGCDAPCPCIRHADTLRVSRARGDSFRGSYSSRTQRFTPSKMIWSRSYMLCSIAHCSGCHTMSKCFHASPISSSRSSRNPMRQEGVRMAAEASSPTAMNARTPVTCNSGVLCRTGYRQLWTSKAHLPLARRKWRIIGRTLTISSHIGAASFIPRHYLQMTELNVPCPNAILILRHLPPLLGILVHHPLWASTSLMTSQQTTVHLTRSVPGHRSCRAYPVNSRLTNQADHVVYVRLTRI